MPKPDHDTMMRLIRQHFAGDLRKAVTFERWKDGIEIEYPIYAIEAFYEAVRNETIEECANVAWNNEPDAEIAGMIRALRAEQ